MLSIIIFVRSMQLRRRIGAQSKLIEIQNKSLETIQKKLEGSAPITAHEQSFLKDLKQASVTTELQKPRSSFLAEGRPVRCPERYKYLKSMFGAGMEIEEMEIALGMSRHEIDQIQKLSSLCSAEKRTALHTSSPPQQ